MNKKSVLVIFGKSLPKRNKSWWRQFDKVIYGEDLEKLVKPGSVQQAYELANNLSRLTISDGSRLSKLINYKGYELWWIHYETIYLNFCLPYTQYVALLLYLKDFDRVYLYRPLYPDLFRYFLKAYNRRCLIISKFRLVKLFPVPVGIFIQCLLSLCSLPFLKIAKPELFIRTSDRLDALYDFDFRQQFFYKELRKNRVPFAEFIRTSGSWLSVLQNAWQRRRPAIYSGAIIAIMHSLASPFNRFLPALSKSDPEKYFWSLVAIHYLKNFRGTILSIQAMKFILRWIGIKAAIIPAGADRTFHEILGCKLAGIKTVGIQYGATPRYFVVSDFMPEFDGEKTLSLDKYGLWSEWWMDYYIKYSRAFKSEQLYIAGPMRPLLESEFVPPSKGTTSKLLKVLFISEQLADPKEVMPYLTALLEARDFALSLKFRPGQDGFENWLIKNELGLLKKARITKEYINKAIAESDVVVGSHSTAVLEGLAQLKHCIFFWTDKWGDYFDIKNLDEGCFFAENPEELINKIRKSPEVPKEYLKKLRGQLFGDPYQDGSKWVVEQAIEYAKQQ